MSRRISIVFSMQEMEAVVKALEHCGTNSENNQLMLEYFRDPTLVRAAISARRALRGKGSKATASSEPLVNSDQKEFDEIRAKNGQLTSELKELTTTNKAYKELLRGLVLTLEEGRTELALHKVKESLDLHLY